MRCPIRCAFTALLDLVHGLKASDLSGGNSQFVQFLPNWARRAGLSLGLLVGDTAMSAPENLKVSCLPAAFIICADGWNGLVEVQQPCFGWFWWEVSTVKPL